VRIRPPSSALPSRGVAALLAAGLAVGSVVAGCTRAGHEPAPPVTAALAPASPAAAQQLPVHPVLSSILLPSHGSSAVRVTARSTSRFSLLGVTWDDAHDVLATDLQVRTRVAGTVAWRPWAALAPDDAQPDVADGAGRPRGGTAPFWAGDSDGVQLRERGRGGRLPDGLRLDLVDPGRAGGPGTSPPRPTSSAPHPTSPRTPSTTSLSVTAAAPRVSRIGRGGPVTALAGPTSAGPKANGLTSAGPTALGASDAAIRTSQGPPYTARTSAAQGTTEAAGTATASSPTDSASAAPSLSPSPTAPPTRGPSPSTSPSPAWPEGTRPPIVGRAGWQADESIRRAAPAYSSAAKVVFVHHTTSSNGYDCSQSPAIIRGEYAYHTLALGWNDIGYNFLIDRCGTVYEGRYGGVDRPVIGAQTYGFNTDSAGVAVIGTYSSTAAPPAVLASVARLAAWKLSLAGLAPTGTSTLVESAADSHGFVAGRSYVLPTISGHRDGYATACPGDALYAQLPAVRLLAAANGGPVGPVVTVTGAAAANGRFYTTGLTTVSWSAASSGAEVTDYAVLVDGRVAVTNPPDLRTVTLTFPPGTHTVTVRATYRPSGTDGTPSAQASPETTATPTTTTTLTPTAMPTTATPTAQGPATLDSVPVTVIADVTRPVFVSLPRLGLRAGTVNDTGVPVSLTWRASDDTYLARVAASSPASATFSGAATTWAATVVPGVRTYALTATDGAGNTRTATTSGRTALVPETDAVRRGNWGRSLSTSHLGGSALSSRTRGDVISWSFNGSAVAWIATRTKASGQAVVYLDGVNAGTVDLASPYTSFRQSVWTRSGLTAARHTVTVVVVGTSTRPTVITDGILYLSAE